MGNERMEVFSLACYVKNHDIVKCELKIRFKLKFGKRVPKCTSKYKKISFNIQQIIFFFQVSKLKVHAILRLSSSSKF